MGGLYGEEEGENSKQHFDSIKPAWDKTSLGSDSAHGLLITCGEGCNCVGGNCARDVV